LKSLAYMSEPKTQRKVERSTFESLPPLENFRAKVGLRYTQPVPEEELPREFMRTPIPKRRLKKEKKTTKGFVPAFEVFTIKTPYASKCANGKICSSCHPLLTWNIIWIYWLPLKRPQKNCP